MRLGAPVYDFKNAEEWAARHKEKGYGAAYWVLGANALPDEVDSYKNAAEKNNIVIAEVGAWSNIVSLDSEIKAKAIEYNIRRLKIAEYVGARCCVNIAGSKSPIWDGYNKDNYLRSTFDEIADTVKYIIDSANIENTYYTIELMPWAIPDSAESYLELIKKVDRPQFAVHLDPVNIITSPRAYCFNGDIIEELFDKLGIYVRSAHAKDIILENKFISHISETRPGLGTLDYSAYLNCLSRLDDIPLMLEHLSGDEEYDLAANYIRKTAEENSLKFNV